MRNGCGVLPSAAGPDLHGVQNLAGVRVIIGLFFPASESELLRGRTQCSCCFYSHLFCPHTSSPSAETKENF